MGNINSRTTITTTNNSGANVAVATINPTGDDEEDFSQPIAGSSTNVHFSLTLDPAKVSFVRIDSDVTCDVYTNAASTGSPTDHWAIVGGTPKIYPLGTLAGIPFTGAITAGIWVTVPGATAGTLSIYAVKAL